MTCIVGIAQGGTVWIGGDSAGVDTSRHALSVRADPKVFRIGDFVMGFTSSFRMGQLLAYALHPPLRRPEADVHAFMVTEFVDAVRDCLKAGGYAEKHDGAERGGAFLVGYAGRLFHIDSDYQVGENACGFDACGCGDQSGRSVGWSGFRTRSGSSSAPRGCRKREGSHEQVSEADDGRRAA